MEARDDGLARALAFERAIRTRGAERSIELPGGAAVLHDGLRRLHHLNALILDAPLPEGTDAGAVMELADRHLAHLPHRHVVLDDGAAAERLAPDFERAGWTVERVLFMVLAGDPAPDRDPDPPRNGAAVEVEPARLRELERRIDEEEELARGWPPGSAEAVSDGMRALRAGTPTRCFAAAENGTLASTCTVFVGRGMAMLDNVGTLTAHRGRGLARAVITAAVRAARSSGCELVVVPADAEDWPRRLYARLGFIPLGTQVAFTLWSVNGRPGSARSAR